MTEDRLKLTLERLKTVLSYDPITGVFVSSIPRQKCPPGTVLGSETWSATLAIGIDGRNYQAHYLAAWIMMGVYPARRVVALNHNLRDTRWPNLHVTSEMEEKNLRARYAQMAQAARGLISPHDVVPLPTFTQTPDEKRALQRALDASLY